MNEKTMTEPKADDPVLNPKRRSHDRQYWDDRLKRYVDFETPAEVPIDAASDAPARKWRRRSHALARSPEKRAHALARGERLGRLIPGPGRVTLDPYKPPSDDERRMVRNRRKTDNARREG